MRGSYRKLPIIIMMLLLVIIPQSSYASVPKSELAIGGIPLYADESSIKSIYGEPTKIENHTIGVYDKTFYYGDSFIIHMLGSHAMAIISNANNGLATPAGITVGTKAGDLYKIYGHPERYYVNSHGRDLIYLWDEHSYCGISFKLINGIISEMCVFEQP